MITTPLVTRCSRCERLKATKELIDGLCDPCRSNAIPQWAVDLAKELHNLPPAADLYVWAIYIMTAVHRAKLVPTDMIEVKRSHVVYLGGDIQAGLVWTHGDNGHQEFYEHHGVASGITLGILRNHTEKGWVVYAQQGERTVTLNSATQNAKGEIVEQGRLYGVFPLDPPKLLSALYELYERVGSEIMEL